jgi:hypothetical protein
VSAINYQVQVKAKAEAVAASLRRVTTVLSCGHIGIEERSVRVVRSRVENKNLGCLEMKYKGMSLVNRS